MMFGAPRRTLLVVMTIALLLGAAGSVWGVLTGPAGPRRAEDVPAYGFWFRDDGSSPVPDIGIVPKKDHPGGYAIELAGTTISAIASVRLRHERCGSTGASSVVAFFSAPPKGSRPTRVPRCHGAVRRSDR